MWFFPSPQSSSTKIFVERKDVPTGCRTLNTRTAERLSNRAGTASNQFSISLNATVHTKHSLCKPLSQSEANTCSIWTRDARQGCEALYKIWLTGNQYYKQTHNKGSITARMHKPALCYSTNTCKVCVSSGKSSFQLYGNIQWHNIPETGKYCKQTHMLILLNRVIHHSIFSCALVSLWQGLF